MALCHQCSKRDVLLGSSRCKQCHDANRKNVEYKRLHNICTANGCTNKADEGFKTCETCRERWRGRSRVPRGRRIHPTDLRGNLCAWCGEPWTGHLICLRCEGMMHDHEVSSDKYDGSVNPDYVRAANADICRYCAGKIEDIPPVLAAEDRDRVIFRDVI